jgi:hypothetical protein
MILVSFIYSFRNHNTCRNKSKSQYRSTNKHRITNGNRNTNHNNNKNGNENDIEDLLNADNNSLKEEQDYDKFFNNQMNKNQKNHKNFNQDKIAPNSNINMLETSSHKKKNKNSSKPNRNKKSKRTIPNAKLFSQFNPYYPNKKSIIDENTSASYCQHKRGFLHLVKNSSKLGISPLSIRTIPVYVVLRDDMLNIQMGLSYRTLFSSVKVENILKITKRFKNANCFEIIEDAVEEQTLTKSPITLCSGNANIMMEWVGALQEFKDCLYNVSSKNQGKGDKTLLDFNRINTLIKSEHHGNSNRGKGIIGNGFDHLFYDSGNTVHFPGGNSSSSSTSMSSSTRTILNSAYIDGPNGSGSVYNSHFDTNGIHDKRKQDDYVMREELNGIVGLLEEGSINNKKMKRNMDSKLKNAEKIERDIRDKHHMIDQILENRERLNKERESKILSEVHKKREIQLLRAVKSRILQYKVRKFNKN